jgi:8-oxo-dGTP pyrophosphatase MutT (NUDIX family)/inorganic pyrophosphatase
MIGSNIVAEGVEETGDVSTDADSYTVEIERPVGSSHPDYPSIVYSLNYGYVEGVTTESGEHQGAYIVGLDTPVERFTGKKIAVVHRDPPEDKWVIAPDNMPFNKQQIEEMVYFIEQYYDSSIEMLNEELWDAYDRDENFLGYQIPRSMAKSLPDGVYHIVSFVYSRRSDGCVLVTQRSRNKTYPLKWEITGGSILAGETPQQGAVRELVEETGIAGDTGKLELLYHHVDDRRHCIYYCYKLDVPQDTKVHLQMGETMDAEFLPFEEFLALVGSDRFIPSEQGRFRRYQGDIVGKLKE